MNDSPTTWTDEGAGSPQAPSEQSRRVLSPPPRDPAAPDEAPATLDEAGRTPEGLTGSPLEAEVIAALKTVYDPEIPVDIYELGLVYAIRIDAAQNHADIDMTLTAPGCPVAGSMPGWVQEAVEGVEGIDTATVDMVWDPPWTPDMMSMRAKLELNML